MVKKALLSFFVLFFGVSIAYGENSCSDSVFYCSSERLFTYTTVMLTPNTEVLIHPVPVRFFIEVFDTSLRKYKKVLVRDVLVTQTSRIFLSCDWGLYRISCQLLSLGQEHKKHVIHDLFRREKNINTRSSYPGALGDSTESAQIVLRCWEYSNSYKKHMFAGCSFVCTFLGLASLYRHYNDHGLQAKLQSLESINSQLKGRVSTLTGEHERLLKTPKGQLEIQKQELRETIRALTKEKEELAQHMGQLQIDLASAKKRITDAMTAKCEQDKKDHAASLEANYIQLLSNNTEVVKLNEENVKLRVSIELKDETIATLRRSASQVGDIIQDATAQADSHVQQIAGKERIIAEKDQELALKIEALEELNGEVRQLNEALINGEASQSLIKKNQELTTMNLHFKKTNEDLNQKNISLTETVERLQAASKPIHGERENILQPTAEELRKARLEALSRR